MPTSHKLQTKSNFAQQMMQILSRPVGAGGAAGAPPDFNRSVNPISWRWADYAHHITTAFPPSDF